MCEDAKIKWSGLGSYKFDNDVKLIESKDADVRLFKSTGNECPEGIIISGYRTSETKRELETKGGKHG